MYRLNTARQLKREQVEFRVIKNERAARTSKSLKVLFSLSALSVGLVVYSIFCRGQLVEITEQINQITRETEVLESENLRLLSQEEEKMSVNNLEEQAIKLGMGKVQGHQVEYICIPRKDNVEVSN